MNEKHVNYLGYFAATMSISMYISYIDQIIRNLNGHPGSIILPIVTTMNCIAWSLYAWLLPKVNLPILMSNLPGIVLGTVTAVTAIVVPIVH